MQQITIPLNCHDNLPEQMVKVTKPKIVDNLLIHYIDVGQGDSMLLMHQDKVMLIDSGPPGHYDQLSAYLKKQGISHIDILISTHAHEDHIGGMPSLVKEFSIGTAYDSTLPMNTYLYETYLTLIDNSGIGYKQPHTGDIIVFTNDINITVISPPKTAIVGAGENDTLNANSVALKLTYGSLTFLFMGDATMESETLILKDGIGKVDVLKVGHHGSQYASSMPFLTSITPAVSIIEVGENNRYGHPKQVTLDDLSKIKSTIYRTDLNGNIVLSTDGNTYTVTPTKKSKTISYIYNAIYNVYHRIME